MRYHFEKLVKKKKKKKIQIHKTKKEQNETISI